MRFIKELIILILIVVFIFSIDIITKNITKKNLSQITNKLNAVEENLNTKENKNIMNELLNTWKNVESKLAFFMEHNELEQISSKMTNAKLSLENENIGDTKLYLDEIKYRIEHIKNKQKLELKNIF